MNALILTPPHRAWLDWPETRRLARAFAAAGQELRFVGGAVRDSLLARPVLEVDAATPATPGAVTALLERAGIKAVPTGVAHGTVTAVVDGRPFEITTLRRDVACHGRHAEVEYTDRWEEDALRRDFTMNALYCTPEGEVTDYAGGAEDALAGRVRFIGEAERRIKEDALRILRFFRFHAHYGADPPDADALAACAALADMVGALSGERVGAEMFKLLASPRAAEALESMRRTGVLAHALDIPAVPLALARLPEACAALGVAQQGEPALAAILRGLPGPLRMEALERVRGRWKFSGKIHERLRALLAEAALAADADEAALKRHIRRLGAPLFCDLALLSAAEGDAPHNYRRMLSLAATWRPPAFPVTGGDLKSIGVPPGPEMGRLLREMEEYWEAQGYAPDKHALLRRAARGER